MDLKKTLNLLKEAKEKKAKTTQDIESCPFDGKGPKDGTGFGKRFGKGKGKNFMMPNKMKNSKKNCMCGEKHESLDKETENLLAEYYEIYEEVIIEGKKPKLGTGERFKELSGKLKKKGVKDPKKLAAFIGRKKFGKDKFQELAKKGKKK